jgi:Flp pilus assembly protein TadG
MLEHDNEWVTFGTTVETDRMPEKRGNDGMKRSGRTRGRFAESEKAARRFPPVDDLVKRFLDREGGAVTIEFVLWLPLLLAILLVAVDASVLYMRQANMWQVSRDTARIVSRHAMDEQTAEAYARARSELGSTVPTVQVFCFNTENVVDCDAGPLVTVRMAANLTDLAPIGILNFALRNQMTAQVTQAVEPR